MQIDRLEVIIESEAKKANAELDKLTANLKQVAGAMSGIKGFGAKNPASAINSTAASLSNYTKATSKAITSSRSLTSQISRLAFSLYSIKRIATGIGDSIRKSMDFGETVNLFQTSFKKIGMETAESMGMEWGSATADTFAIGFIEQAQDFNDLLTNSLSLDPEMMLRYQAIFAQMTNSMGLVAESSMNISESFTMLGTDIASLWNIDTDKAMKKLQSGLAGQIRPLRELGIDISKTSLEMTAMNHGITDSVEKMSQAAKVQLRWLSIMEQTEVAFGDMAKTIESPANQMRILSQQWTNLSRSIGSVFLPVITNVLPYINATVIAIRNMVDTLAAAMGYEIPDYSDSNIYTDVTGDIEGMEDAADGATEANEKLKRSIMGIDELNILSKNANSLAGIGLGSGYSELDEAINQKNISYMAKFSEEMGKMSNKAKDMAENIQAFFGNIGEKVEPTTTALKKLWDEGLSKLAGFAGTDMINWYEKFLFPVGEWVLGEGLPGLFTSLNNLLTAINWDNLNNALGDLYDALAPMVIGIGKGLVNFIQDVTEFLSPVLSITVDALALALSALADMVNNVDPETWEKAGYAIGVVGTSIAGIKIAAGLPVLLLKVKDGLSGIVSSISNLSTMSPVALPALFDLLGIDDWLDELYEKLPDWVTDLWEGFWQAIYDGVVDVFNLDETLKIWGQVADAFREAFDGDGDTWYEIGGNIIKGIFLGIAGILSAPLEIIVDFFKALIENIKNVFGINSPAEKMKPYGEYIMQGLMQGIKDGWVKGWETFKTWLAYKATLIASAFSKIKEYFTIKGGQIISGIKQGWNDGWESLRLWLSKIPSIMADAIGSLFSTGKSLMDGFVSGLLSVSIPSIVVPEITYSGGTSSSGRTHSSGYRQFATGGIPEFGQMFIAREAGPELVGRIGNQTAVVNNDQIVQAVSQGVAVAVASVLGGQGGGQIIHNVLQLDSDVVYQAYNRAKSSNNGRFNPVMQGG